MKKASLTISILVLTVTVLLSILALSLGGPADIGTILIGQYISPVSFAAAISSLIFAVLDIRKNITYFAKLPIILSIVSVIVTVVPVFVLVYSGFSA
jgi:hypothetical protein